MVAIAQLAANPPVTNAMSALCQKGHWFGLEVEGAGTLDGASGRDRNNLQMSMAALGRS